MNWASIFATFPKEAIPLISAIVGGLLVLAGQYFTHRFTRKREHEKLLREKAEELVKTLCQIRHTLFVWHEEMMRQAKASEPRGEETQAEFVARRRSASREYQDVVPSLLSDLTRAKTLQLLYFPSLKRYLEAHSTAVFRLIKWLESQAGLLGLQEPDSPQRLVPFFEKDAEQWFQLIETHGTACEEAIEAVVRAVPPPRKLARAWAHLRRSR